MPANRRILFPFLALLFTTLAFVLLFFSVFLSSPGLFRLLQGPTHFYSLPTWLRYCLLHPALLTALGRMGFGSSLLGSMLTLFLLLKTEPPNKAYGHLAGIGWAVLLVTALFVLVLAPILVSLTLNLHGFSPSGKQLYLKSLAIDSGKVLLVISSLVFVAATVLTSLIKIITRLNAAPPTRLPPGVLQ